MATEILRQNILADLQKVQKLFESSNKKDCPDILPDVVQNGLLEKKRLLKREKDLKENFQPDVINECSVAILQSCEYEDKRTLITRVGSVRGVKNGVEEAIRQLKVQTEWTRNYTGEDRNKVVVYVSSLGVVRRTWERCRKCIMILEQNAVRFERRDLYLRRGYVAEFKNRTGLPNVTLPQIYVDGEHFGDDEKLERWNENGILRIRLSQHIAEGSKTNCAKCYGFGVLPCRTCHGGKKSSLTYKESEKETQLIFRCAKCDASGLVLCTEQCCVY